MFRTHEVMQDIEGSVPLRPWRRTSVPGRALLAIILGIAICPIAALDSGAQDRPLAVDRRERLTVPAPARDMVLAEMRTMLSALSGVLDGLSRDEGDAASAAARSAGVAVAVDMDPAVRQLLPEAFVELGTSTHRQFDAVAAEIDRGARTEVVIGELADLTAKCGACHASYRIDEAR